MTKAEKPDMMCVTDGWVQCPYCQTVSGRRLLRLLPETEAHALEIYCRGCKSKIRVEIHKGQVCYKHESR